MRNGPSPADVNPPRTQSWDRGILPRIEQIGEKVPGIVFLAGLAVIMLAAIAVKQGGFIHIETEQYIPHYLSNRPILEKIFDFNKVEIIRVFRPRPLSYLIDDLDVAFLGWSASKGHAHFESASYFVFWTLNALLLWYSFRKLFHVDRLISALLIGLLGTSPIIFLNTHYFRSAKPGAVFFMLCAFIALWRCFEGVLNGRRPIVDAFLSYLLLVAACLFDEIPPAFCLAAIMMFALEIYLSRGTNKQRAAVFCMVPVVVALFTFAIYDLWIHKRLVTYFTGQTAPMDFQTSFIHALLTHTINAVVGSVSVFTEAFGYLTGNLSSALATTALIFFTIFWQRFSGTKAAIRVVAGGVLMFGILFGMVSQEHFILHFEPRRMLYAYPLTYVFVVFLGFTVQRMITTGLMSRGLVQAIFLALVASNATVLPTHWRILMEDGKRTAYSRAMVLALRSPVGITNDMLHDPGMGEYYALVSKSDIYSALKRK